MKSKPTVRMFENQKQEQLEETVIETKSLTKAHDVCNLITQKLRKPSLF